MGNVFDGDSYPEGMSEKRCKPDYEKQIKQEKDQTVVAQKLLDSLYEYLEVTGQSSSRKGYEFTLQSLLGGLHLEIRNRDKTINKLIELQEKDKSE